MYGLPKDFDFSVFEGRTLELVCFSENTVNLSFDDHLSITIESSYSHQVDDEDPGSTIDIPPETSTLMQLTGDVVELAEAVGKGTLVLHFEGGQVLKCFEDLPNYECYKITHHGKET